MDAYSQFHGGLDLVMPKRVGEILGPIQGKNTDHVEVPIVREPFFPVVVNQYKYSGGRVETKAGKFDRERQGA